jgi:hypothetical protein
MVFGFQNELRQLLTYVITEGNPILNTYFDANVTYNLTLEIAPTTQKYSFYLTQQRFRPPVYKIKLNIPDYYGFKEAVKKPHSFLNEAKLTGIGLALRLAVLKKRVEDAKIRALVLDDLLISLDMKLRKKIIGLLLDEYSNRYQIIHFTHDRNLFELMKDAVLNKREGENWKFLEISEFISSGIKTCKIEDSKSHIQRAYEFYNIGDRETAGNWMRKEAERFCRTFLPHKKQINRNGEKLNANGLILNTLHFAESNGLDLTLFKKLDSHRKFVFNVLSHDSYDVEVFEDELEECFNTFEMLKLLKFKTVLGSGSKLEFEMQDSSFLWRAEFTINDELRLIKEPNKESILPKVNLNYKIFKDGNLYKSEHGYESIKNFYDRWYNTSDKSLNPDFWEEVKISNSGSLLKTIREF